MPQAFRKLLLLVTISVVPVLAMNEASATEERTRHRLSPEDQRKYDELIRSARRHQALAELAIRLGFVFMGAALLYGAYSTFRKGFKISEKRRIEGSGARIIAGILVLLGVGVIVLGCIYAPSLLPAPVNSP
jgi:hypothetical protein